MTYRTNLQSGFTFIEMLIVFAIFVSLLTLVAPAYQQMVFGNRMIGEVYTLRATLNNARSEALTRRAPVVVCPTVDGENCLADTDDWRQGYMAFVDTNNDNAPDPDDADEERIQFNVPDDGLNIVFDNANERVRFDPTGEATGFQGTFVFCDARGANAASALILNAVGSVRAATDTDDPEDSIVNVGADNVSCS